MEKIKIIHHGGAIRERKIELMIKMMDYLDPERYDLTLMLVPTEKKYYDKLVRMASKHDNVHFVQPVSFKEIPSFTNKFDIGLFLIFPTNFNYEHCLPNKFFEFIQARLMIAIGPSVEMKGIVEKYNLGCVAADFKPKSLAKKIASMSPEQIFECKKNCDAHAREFSAETNKAKLRDIIERLAG